MDWNIRLEFNEKQNGFHFERLDNRWVHQENTHGWETIERKMSMNDADKFCDYFKHVHRNRKKWTLILVRKEFEWYKRHMEYCKIKDKINVVISRFENN